MIVLALDLAGDPHGAALWRDGAILAARAAPGGPAAAAAAGPALCGGVLRDAGLDWAAIDRLACGRGPGGFTGLRAALAYMAGLSLALDRPLTGVSGFSVLRARAETAAALLPAGRGELFMRPPNGPDAVGAPEALAARTPAGAPLIGPGAPALAALTGGAVLDDAPPSAAGFAAIAASRAPGAAPPRPLYIRPPKISPAAADRAAALGRPA